MKNKNRTIVVDFGEESYYQNIIGNGKAFLEFVMAYIMSIGFQLLHKQYCTGGSCLTRHSHYARVKCGGITIWRIQCTTCKAVFTVMPSFLIRYFSCKTEQVKRAIIAYHGGLSFENCAICYNISPMCLYRLICAFGKHCLATMLYQAGVPLPKNLQADEKHTKCLGEKGYIPLLTCGHAIWDIDYIDNVDEQTLAPFYQQFVEQTKALEPNYAPKTITHDGFKATIKALREIFKNTCTYLLCWLHACRSIGNIITSYSKEEADKISGRLWIMLLRCHKKVSLKNVSRRSCLTALLRKYKPLLPPDIFEELKAWIDRKKPYFYAGMDYPLALSFSYSIDHICNHLDRKLFMMKHFHHPNARKDLFLKGFALLHCFIPYQRFAINAFKSPAQVEGASLPHHDWFVSLLILTSQGYHKIR